MPRLPPDDLHFLFPLAPNVAITGTNPGASAECSLAISQSAPNNVLCAVRHVPSAAEFVQSDVIIYRSADSGASWKAAEALSLIGIDPQSFAEITFGANANPSVAWDDEGHAYLLTLAVTQDQNGLIGIAFYKSKDAGATWSQPILIDIDHTDDKPNILIDTQNKEIYAIWMRISDMGNTTLALARSDFLGNWTVEKTIDGASDYLGSWPSVALSPDGVLYIASRFGDGFRVVKSLDLGAKFIPCEEVDNIDILDTSGATVQIGNVLESADTIENSNFRANSFISICAGKGGSVLCAWLEPIYGKAQYAFEEGPLKSVRLVYLRSQDCGETWIRPIRRIPEGGPFEPPSSGFLLSKGFVGSYVFSPQLSICPGGTIVCNYYVYSPLEFKTGELSVFASFSSDEGASFSAPYKISEQPWVTDPTETKMIALGDVNNPAAYFIGDYFGLATGSIGDMGADGFINAWTDGGSGSEQITSSTVRAIPK